MSRSAEAKEREMHEQMVSEKHERRGGACPARHQVDVGIRSCITERISDHGDVRVDHNAPRLNCGYITTSEQ